jgi:signal peptidase I
VQNTGAEPEVFPLLRLQKTRSASQQARSAEALFPDPAETKKATKPKAAAIPKVTGPAVVGKTLWALFCVIAFSILAYFLFSRFVITAVVIQGRSMQPTLQDGERYYLNRWRYLFVAPKHGDVVVLKDPGHRDFAVKRIVAGPNDWVTLRDGNLFLNGKRLVEPYLPEGMRTTVPDRQEKWILLGPDQYYVLGDNRSNSEDSRFYGMVKRKNIVGVLVK